MRRLPAERMLDELIRRGALTEEAVSGVASFLANYYHRAEPAAVDGEAYRAAIAAHVADNRRVLLAAAEIDTDRVRRIHTAQLRYLTCRGDVFRTRARERRVIDGHGDLRPEHVCLVDPPAVFDCIEFSPDSRRVDVLDELCFFAMECDAAGASAVGARVLDAYRRLSHDEASVGLALFYKAYRATVRAKVAALRAEQVAGAARQESYGTRDRYLGLADEYLRTGGVRPLLILVTGLMGTGKSTLARELGEALGIEVLRTDVVRSAVVPAGQGNESFGVGRYGADARGRVYDELLRRARERLARGASVILDGTFIEASKRADALGLGRDLNADTSVVRCACPRETALERIAARLKSAAGDPSEARPELYDLQAAEEARSGLAGDGLSIDTTAPRAMQLANVLAALPPVFGAKS
jgi:predicted kinase